MNRFSIRLLGFVALSVITFVALLLAWSFVGEIYAGAFRSVGNVVNNGGLSREVWFTTPDAPSAGHDVLLRLVNRAAGLQQSHEISSRRHAYMPTAFFIAMTLAAPIPWRRRLWALAWGLMLVNLYIVLKLMLLPAAYPVPTPGSSPGTLASILSRTFWILDASSAGWMIIPLLIWLLLIIPSKNLLLSKAD